VSHAAYITSLIENGDHDGVKIDPFGWRLHTRITRFCRQIRPELRMGGKSLVEIDVANAQPLLLGIFLSKPEVVVAAVNLGDGDWSIKRESEKGEGPDRREREEGGGGRGELPLCLARALYDLREGEWKIDPAEIRDFAEVAGNGEFYEKLMEGSGFRDRDRVKDQLWSQVFFCKPHIFGKITEAFGKKWPSILKGMRMVKSRCGYKIFAKILQRLESVLLIDGVCGRMVRDHPEVGFLTIHDSALIVAQEVQLVREMMVEEFRRWGAKVIIRIKGQQR
jgi:hypothetical protein